MRRRRLAAGLALAAIVLSGGSRAQDGGLSPTLAAIKKANTVRLGYRDASPPFSFLDQAGRPIGYSLELCEAIVEEIGLAADAPELRIEHVRVTPETRIAAVLDGRIDLECGSTTNNAERRQRVAFSPMIFLAGTRLMVPRAARAADIGGLKGRSIVVTRGTTNGPAIEAADRRLKLGIRLVTADDHEQSYQLLADGKVDAFATDDILLQGLIVRHRAQDRFKVVGDLLSYEPYGIMYRKDEPQLAAAVERTFRRLATGHDLVPLYEKWFVRRLPTGERLGVPMPPQLEETFALMNASPGARQ